MKRAARDSNLELLRIASMFLIVLFHCAFHGTGMGIGRAWQLGAIDGSTNQLLLESLLFGGGTGVNCFVLISGYFMIRQRITLKKLLKLWGTVVTYSLGIFAILQIRNWYTGTLAFSPVRLIASCLPLVLNLYWFVSVYVLLMLVSPFLNHYLCSLSRAGTLRYLAGLTVLIAAIPNIFPSTALGGELAWFIMLYSIGAATRQHGSRLLTAPKRWFIASACIWLLMEAGVILTYAASPYLPQMFETPIRELFIRKEGLLTLLLSISLFLGFAACRIGSIRGINTISACTLGVYLFHDGALCQLIWNKIFHVREMLDSPWLFPYCLGTAIAVYMVGTLIEMVRQATLGRLYDKWAPHLLLPRVYAVWHWLRRPLDRLG